MFNQLNVLLASTNKNATVLSSSYIMFIEWIAALMLVSCPAQTAQNVYPCLVDTPFSILFVNKFNAELMLPFIMYFLNFFNISAIDDVFCMVFSDTWIVSPPKYNSSNFPLCHSSKRRSSASWWSLNLEFLDDFSNKKFDISITDLDSLIHSFNSLVVSSI